MAVFGIFQHFFLQNYATIFMSLCLLQDMKAAKVSWRSAFDSFKDQRSMLGLLSSSIVEAKQQLLAEFHKWLTSPVSG
jgi:hypothetical protein